MNGLRRQAPRLLSIVGNKPHATADDHAEPIPNYDERGSGTTKDPGSSDSDASNVKGWNAPRPRKKIIPPGQAANRRRVTNIHGSVGSGAKATGKKVPMSPSLSKPVSEEHSLHPAEASGDEAERVVFSQSNSQKRLKSGYGKSFKKVKSSVPGDTSGLPAKPMVGFRKPVGVMSEDGESHGKVLALAKPCNAGSHDANNDSSSAGPSFRLPQGVGPDTLPASTETSALSKHPDSPSSSRPRSSSLSSLYALDSDDEVEVQSVKPLSLGPTSPCPLCGEQVDISFKHDFQAEQCGGRRMNFRLQELFCRLHKERTAKQAWQDREYPEIDWETLHARLLKHNQHIRDVLSGNVKSHYRDKLKAKLRSGKSKTTMQTLEQGAQGVSQVGYYGTRGEKMMTNHILKHFGSELRERAGSDKVMSAMGVSGGVSGYVQSILVPEMVLALVMEDAECGTDEAMRIISDSTDIGDALNEVEEEKVPHIEMLSSQDQSD